MSERCETCRYWREVPTGGEGVCRRFPPVRSMRDGVPITLRTHTGKNYWCGEWREREPDRMDPAQR